MEVESYCSLGACINDLDRFHKMPVKAGEVLGFGY
jgi:hypothetical protein